MYCVSQLWAFPSYGHCLNLHCPDKGGFDCMYVVCKRMQIVTRPGL